MPQHEIPCTCRILRYVPSLLRDEHVNIGVLLHDAGSARLELRLIESDSEFARLRRMHPAADLDLLRGLEADLRAQLAHSVAGTEAWLGKLEQTLSTTIQLSPQRAVFTTDFDAELDRIYSDQVAPLRTTRAEAARSRAGLRRQANEILARTGVLRKLKRSLRVDEFTYPGDPMRLDYAWRQNGARGFLHALSLDRDPAQAKALAFTSQRIQAKVAGSEFTAICDTAPAEGNTRHRFVAELLRGQQIALVPLATLENWALDLNARLQ